MYRRLFCVFVLLSLCSIATAVNLVKDGKPQAEIVISDTPARMTRLAVSNLQEYVFKMTGATLPVTNAPSGKLPVKIYVGRSKHTEALKLSTEGLAHGAFRMASGPNWLALLGPDGDFTPMEPFTHSNADKGRALQDWDAANPGEHYGFPYFRLGTDSYSPELDIWHADDAGTMNAVCEFLRSLGVRWYFPGELGEVVPRQATIAIPAVDKTVRPDFPVRQFSYWYNDRENRLWNLRMGVNGGHELMGLTQNGHGSKWVYMRDEVKKAHPEWYAIWDGARATNHSYSGAPCLSSEGLFQQHLKFARMMFDVRKEPMLSLDVCDGYGRGMCECELCEGLGTPERGVDGLMSDYVWGYVNRVATELYKTHPDRKVSGLSYSAYQLPPAKIAQLSPNLAAILCQWRGGFHDRETRDRALALRRAWLDKLPSKEIYIYDYYLHSRPRYGYDYVPVYFPRLIAEDLRALKGVSLGDMIEVYRHGAPTSGNWGPWDPLAVMHLNIYVTARLWWDANQDLDAMLNEYYKLFYGPAAGEMKAFIEHCEATWPLMTKNVESVDKALDLLEAARAAAGETIYGKRIALAADYVKPMRQLRDRLAKGRQNVPEQRVLPISMKGKKLDGNLEDMTYWPADVRTCDLYETESGRMTGMRGGQPHTSFQIFSGGDDALYFGIRCSETDMTNLAVTATRNDDTNIWSGDYVQVLIETQTHSYYRLSVNPAGALTDVDMGSGEPGGSVAWSSGAQAAVQIGTNGWTAELRVPWAGEMARQLDPMKGIDGRQPSLVYPWSIYVCRQRVRNGKAERAAWSPTGTNRLDDVMKFGSVYIK